MTYDVEISAVARALDAVEVAIRAVHDRLHIEGLFDICSQAAAGVSGHQDLRE